MDRNPVGLIGAGLLGSAVGERWLSAGFAVMAYDADPAARDALPGAVTASSAAAVFEGCRRIALVLPDSGVSEHVLAEVRPLAAGTIIIDMTTGDPDQMARLARLCAGEGAAYLDATVSGSSAQVRRGEAAVMAGGDVAVFDACHDLFSTFASHAFYAGPPGSGARMKLAVNLVLGLNRAALAEGLAFARNCGLDPGQALEIFRAGAAYSRIMDTKGEKMLRGDFTPQARLAQHRKDVDLILEMASRRGARTPLSRVHRELLAELERQGYAGADNSAIIRAFERGESTSARDPRPPDAPRPERRG